MSSTPTPFDNLPLNTSKVYCSATAPDGCEIVIPCKAIEEAETKKQQLHEWLHANQYALEPELA